MGNDLFKAFGVNIAKTLNDVLAPGLLDATLFTVTQGARPSPDEPPAEVETPHAAKGFIEGFDTNLVDETLVKREDRKITLIGDSIADLAIPDTNDRVTIEGTKYRIIEVNRDPAAATYELQVREYSG